MPQALSAAKENAMRIIRQIASPTGLLDYEPEHGAVAVEGRMVDQATVRLASKLWEQAKYLQLV